jgi:hypothetical protein
MSTLAARIAHRDSAAFVGRARELRIVDELLAAGGVLLVHGPGGIGKSVLLREIRRRAAGWEPFVVDGRDLPPVPDAVEQALAGAWTAERPLVLIDTYERMSALGGYLRSTLLPSLPERAVVVVAGREPPEPGWFEDGWETIAAELPLAALSEHEARALLVRHGLRGDPRAAAIARWAGGLPLALRLGAAAAREDPSWTPGADAAPLRAHLRRVSEAALASEHADVFALACVARVVTPALVADVLPGVDPAAALRWLAGCAFADSRPGGVTLHELVRRPLRAALEPERERRLRARVADSVHARALDDLTLTIDLADLVEDPAVRAGYSWDGGVDHHVTGPGAERLAPDAATQATRSPSPPTRRPNSLTPIRGSVAGSRTRAGEKRSSGGTPSAPFRACRRCSTWPRSCAPGCAIRGTRTCRSIPAPGPRWRSAPRSAPGMCPSSTSTAGSAT